MKKKILIGSIVLAVFAISLFVVYFVSDFIKGEVETLSNITALYSLFTPKMHEWVDSHLEGIECQPREYYYSNSNVCFVCKKLNACFGYAWVNRSAGKMMNPIGSPFLVSGYDEETLINFYSLGIGRVLGCSNCIPECTCEDGVKARLEPEDRVIFRFPDSEEMKERVERITKAIGIRNCEFIELNETEVGFRPYETRIDFFCEKIAGYIKENEVWVEAV